MKYQRRGLDQKRLLVSVIVPSYGRPQRLQALLEQLLAQDQDPSSFEIIIVDDGSPKPVCAELQSMIHNAQVSLRCLRKENGGPASARNFGAQTARGEYLLFVDDDMSVATDFVRGHLETQLEYGPAMVVCQFDWRVEGYPKPFEKWYRERISAWADVRAKESSPISEEVFAIPHPSVTTANLSLRKSDFEEAGGFDSGYPFSCEDQDLGLRLGHKGLKAFFTRRTRATHVETHNTLRRLCRRQEIGAFDTVRFVRRFDVEYNFGLPEIARVNGPVRLGVDSTSLIFKKIVRHMVTMRGFSKIAFGVVKILERVFPHSRLLPRIYALIVSAHIQKGWRDGLQRYHAVAPLKDWKPVKVA